MPSLDVLDSVINILRIVLLLRVLFAFMTSKHKLNRMFGILGLALISILWEVVATYIARGQVAEWGALLNAMGITLFTYMAISVDYQAFLNGTSLVLGSYVIINCLTVILFPTGMYTSSVYEENYFLSYRTAWFAVYLLALTVCFLRYECLKDRFSKFWCITVVISSYLSMIIVWTATGMFSFTVAAIMLIVWKIGKKQQPIKVFYLLLAEAVAFYILVITQMLNRFEFLIVGILNKDLTLTFRTRIWSDVIKQIKKNFLTGIGRLDSEHMGVIIGYGATHPHNHYLHTMLCFGLVGMILFLALVYYSNNKKVPIERVGQKKIIMAAFVAYLTAGQVESLAATGAYIYPLYIIAASLYSKEITSRGDNNVNRISNAISDK